MYEVEVTARFAAAHRLIDYKGKCERLHGHNYRVEAAVQAPAPGRGGMVIDFGDLKNALDKVVTDLDHQYLNEIPPFDKTEPSAENIAEYIFKQVNMSLKDSGHSLHRVNVWESDNSKASYIRD